MENWKTIEEAPRYQVSDLGRVRSLPSVKRGGKLLTLVKNGKYLRVVLFLGKGPGLQRTVHTLVLTAFVGPRPEGMFGLHRDDDGTNNVLANLYWGTPQQNAADMRANGVLQFGHHHVNAKLTPEQVQQIRDLPKEDYRPAELMAQLGVSRTALWQARVGKSYATAQ